MTYSLRDCVLFALLVLSDDEVRQVVALLDAVAAAPLDRTKAVFYDAAGRVGYACAVGRFRVYYFIAKNGHITFTDLRSDAPGA